jgi:3-hydroxyisobutyrate dehydrogenase-like beta-hydroxyacid dehydrogenase
MAAGVDAGRVPCAGSFEQHPNAIVPEGSNAEDHHADHHDSGRNRREAVMSVVGVVGLGAMGSQFAGRLLSAGHEVHGTDRTRATTEALIARGLIWHDTPREVAGAADVVISMVTDDTALESITSRPDGILAGLPAGGVYVDLSSVSPHASMQVAERVAAIGARMLDAPVSGSVPQAEQGTLAIMVGGDEATFQRVEPLLRQLGQTVTRVGDNGAGVLLKLAINISLAVQTLAFSEGLLLAERGGIDPSLAAQVMGSSPIGSPMLKARIPLLLDLPEGAWFTIRLMHKDIRLALSEAKRLGVALPSAAAGAELLEKAEELGYAGRDIAALHEVLDKISAETGA